jgi:hypothetical protein
LTARKEKNIPRRPPLPPQTFPLSRGPVIEPVPVPPAPIITITSDIGWSYASQMKAVLLREAPSVRIVDITHEVSSHQVLEGAFLLRYCGAWFPPGTIHLAVVDPGVGGERYPIVITCRGGTTLVGPDNGLLVPLAEHIGEPKAYHILREKVLPASQASATFEGRDLFAPAAARLAAGTHAAELGSPIEFMPFQFPQPFLEGGTASIAVLYVDYFGNIITNMPTADFHNRIASIGDWVSLNVHTHHFRAQVARTYEELPQGALGVVGSSFGLIELAVNRGRAHDFVGLAPGARFSIQRI